MLRKIAKAFLVLFLAFLAIILLIISLNMIRYSKWESEFSPNEKYLSKGVEVLNEDIQLEIAEFIASEEETDFMEYSVNEIAQVLDFVLNSNLEGISFDSVYIEPTDGLWRIYVKSRVEDINIPWLVLDIVKDSYESPEFYIKNISIGNSPVPSFVLDKVLVLANRGVSEAILLFNENLFSKRYITNISLMEEKVVIKGILY